jgi:cyclopropane fatty-acyl-phospholipid synthase-like methyltransferase
MYRKKIYERYLTTDGFDNFEEIEKQFNSNYYPDVNILKSLPKNKEAKILDLGCGFGVYLKYIKSLGYKNIRGVEIGDEQNKFLKDKGFDIFQSDIFEFLKTTKEKFDFISMFDVLEHFTKEEIVELLPLLQNILNYNGVLIVRVPNGEAIFKGVIMYGDFTHETFFTAKSLKQIFNIFNFSNTQVFPLYPIRHGLKSTIRYYGYQFYELIYKIGVIFEMGGVKNFVSTSNILGIIKK